MYCIRFDSLFQVADWHGRVRESDLSDYNPWAYLPEGASKKLFRTKDSATNYLHRHCHAPDSCGVGAHFIVVSAEKRPSDRPSRYIVVCSNDGLVRLTAL